MWVVEQQSVRAKSHYDSDSDQFGETHMSDESEGGSLSSDFFSPKHPLFVVRFCLDGAEGGVDLTIQPKKHLIAEQ